MGWINSWLSSYLPHFLIIFSPTSLKAIPVASTSCRNNLNEYIPQYMVPEKIIVVDNIPTTENGKTDRKAMIEMAYESSVLSGGV